MVHAHGMIQTGVGAVARLFVSAACLGLLAASAVEAQDKLVAEGANWKYFKGTQEPPPDWKTLEFSDFAWEEGPSPFGYGDITTGTILSDMQNGYLSVYLRIKFTVPTPPPAVNLRIKYDDGFVAYLNGTEFVRKNIPGNPGDPVAFDAVATDHEGTAYEDNIFCSSLTQLKAGENVLAIQGHNVNLPSSDLQVVPELIALSDVCPKDFTCRGTASTISLRWVKPTTTFVFDELRLFRDGTEIALATKAVSTYIDRNPPPGPHNYELRATSCGGQCTVLTCTGEITGGVVTFRRGDSDGNAAVNLSDSVFVLNHLFASGPAPRCPDTGDSNDDGSLNLTDAIFLLNALFAGGPQPPAPGITTCGQDPTADTLAACTYTC
jgi:hypothetical protein